MGKGTFVEDLSQCTVLAVDDSEYNINIIVKVLEQDYKIVTTQSAEAAIKMADSTPPDIILLDVMMPEMDGYEVCTHLKGNPKTKDIPVIFLSAMDEVQNRKKGFQLGAVDYITKPFDLLELQAKVKTHLSLLVARRELAKLRKPA